MSRSEAGRRGCRGGRWWLDPKWGNGRAENICWGTAGTQGGSQLCPKCPGGWRGRGNGCSWLCRGQVGLSPDLGVWNPRDICERGLWMDTLLRAPRQLGQGWGPGCCCCCSRAGCGHPFLRAAARCWVWEGTPRASPALVGGPVSWWPHQHCPEQRQAGRGGRERGRKRGFEHAALGQAWGVKFQGALWATG